MGDKDVSWLEGRPALQNSWFKKMNTYEGGEKVNPYQQQLTGKSRSFFIQKTSCKNWGRNSYFLKGEKWRRISAKGGGLR